MPLEDFQSSFYEDTFWNSRTSVLARQEEAAFNPHFTRTHFEIVERRHRRRRGRFFQSSFYEDTFWNSFSLAKACLTVRFQSSFYEDTFWNLVKETLRHKEAFFQSSFYEDTFWNAITVMGGHDPGYLSILILRGHILKSPPPPTVNTWGQTFNPHFTRTHFEIGRPRGGRPCGGYLSILILRGHILKSGYTGINIKNEILSILILRGHILKYDQWKAPGHRGWTFNPHFTRTHFEIWTLQSARWVNTGFQSSFYEDTFWNQDYDRAARRGDAPLSILILRGHILKLDDPEQRAYYHPLSILILRGHILKCDAYWDMVSELPPFQSSFYEDTFWNTEIMAMITGCEGLSILILRGHILKL